MIKAIALLSGGIDSALAAWIIKQQNIEVEALNFVSVFCRSACGEGCLHRPIEAALRLGIPLKTLNFTEETLQAAKAPKYGYARNMAPCIDCRISMLKKAVEHMTKAGASFLITGEVVLQNSSAQNSAVLELIERESGTEGLILRPLSAKLLKPTLAEINGWVDREKLLAVHGNSHVQQMALAAQYGLQNLSDSQSGCLLADETFAGKVKDLVKHNELDLNNAHLLKFGRHFRLNPFVKIVVSKNETEDDILKTFSEDGDAVIEVNAMTKTVAVVKGLFTNQDLGIAAAITAQFAEAREDSGLSADIRIKGYHGKDKTIAISAGQELVLEEMKID